MKRWPSLAKFGKSLSLPEGELFYYDSEGSADSETRSRHGGKPTIALIHGLGDEADTWRHVFHALAEAGYRVLAPDLPGFGRSRWKGAIGVNVHCDSVTLLLAFADAGAKSPAVALVGSSLGAGVAELIACKRPEIVKGLVLIAGCFPFAKSADKKLLLLGLPFLGRKWYRGFRKNHEAAWKSLYFYYADLDAMNGADRDFLCERVVARVESPNQERGYLSTVGSMNRFFMFGSRFVARKIKRFPGKIFALHGEKDRVFPFEKTALFRSLRPDAEFAIIADAGHLPQQEKPEACVAEILRFVNDLNKTGL